VLSSAHSGREARPNRRDEALCSGDLETGGHLVEDKEQDVPLEVGEERCPGARVARHGEGPDDLAEGGGELLMHLRVPQQPPDRAVA
jgi:hypothetical protein